MTQMNPISVGIRRKWPAALFLWRHNLAFNVQLTGGEFFQKDLETKWSEAMKTPEKSQKWSRLNVSSNLIVCPT